MHCRPPRPDTGAPGETGSTRRFALRLECPPSPRQTPNQTRRIRRSSGLRAPKGRRRVALVAALAGRPRRPRRRGVRPAAPLGKPAVGRRNGAGRQPRGVPVVAATARRGDLPVYLTGLGTVTAFNTVTVRSRVDGAAGQGGLPGGAVRPQGRPAGRDRPAAVRGAARAGPGPAGPRPGAAQATRGSISSRYRDLLAQQFVPQAAVRQSGRAGRPERGRGQGGPGRRSTTPSCS